MHFIFNGVDSRNMGLWFKSAPVIQLPKQRDSTYIIPNRNGTVYSSMNTFDSIEISIECFFDKELTATNLRALKEFFIFRNGDLILSTDMDKFYKARLINNIDLTQVAGVLGECILQFECEPFLSEMKDEYIVVPANDESSNITASNKNLFGDKTGLYKTPESTKEFWYGDGMYDEYVEKTDEFSVCVDGTVAYSLGFMCNFYLDSLIQEGFEYTVSFDIKTDKAQSYQVSFYKGDATAPLHFNVDVPVAVENEWTRVSYTFTALETSSIQNWYIYPSWGPKIAIKQLKIEAGTVATDWNNGTEVVLPETELKGSISIINDTILDLEPHFVINTDKERDVELIINKVKTTFLQVNGELVIDCENVDVFHNNNNYAHKMIGDFPVLKKGENIIEYKNANEVKFKMNKKYV